MDVLLGATLQKKERVRHFSSKHTAFRRSERDRREAADGKRNGCGHNVHLEPLRFREILGAPRADNGKPVSDIGIPVPRA